MKKFLFLLFVTFIFIGCLQTETTKEKTKLIGMPNPWTDCGNNLVQAAEIAGFTFPLVLSNYHVRAMKGMIQISYPLDEFRTVLVRKTDDEKYSNNGDISGVYTQYPINKVYMLHGSVPLKLRGTEDKIYVMNMVASSGYYCAYCEQGMALKEIEEIYNIIAEAETKTLI